MTTASHPVFVPADTAGTRKETAILLVGTAREFDIPQRSIQPMYGGFRITDALADVLYDESAPDEEEVVVEPEPEPKPKTKAKSTTKTSGDRAAKNEPTEKE